MNTNRIMIEIIAIVNHPGGIFTFAGERFVLFGRRQIPQRSMKKRSHLRGIVQI